MFTQAGSREESACLVIVSLLTHSTVAVLAFALTVITDDDRLCLLDHKL